jgi:transaldolase / glucose-6-phosphate isomerase
MNPLKELGKYGQSVWLDYIRRNLIASGELDKLILEDGLCGVTSNPAIFEKAIVGSTDYSEALAQLVLQKGMTAKLMYERLAIADIQAAADILHPVYVRTQKKDGYVSLEVSPHLARNAEGTIEEAKRLWKEVNRENVMIKVPGTDEGAIAIQELIACGINVNVTLLFSQEYYAKAAEAFLSGLELRVKRGQEISHIASVASFFISRIDSLVEKNIQELLKKVCDADKVALAHLVGKIAIANAKLTYHHFKEIYRQKRFQYLESKGAQKQRLLWASTSTKNPQYSDVYYVEELIGPDTVDTIPPATFDAFRKHGKVQETLNIGLEEAGDQMSALEKIGISFKKVTDQLLGEGIVLFAEAFDKLIAAIEEKRKAGEVSSRKETPFQHAFVAGTLAPHIREMDVEEKESIAVIHELNNWADNHKVHRLWARDASLWSNSDESNWMGWLGISEVMLAEVEELVCFASEIKGEKFTDVVLLGMGGSSLCPQVLERTFGKISGYPQLHVLDSTDPAQVKSIEDGVDLKKTLFVVSSKSGGTLEPNIFKQYFFEKVKAFMPENPGRHFVAITDPKSKLESIAQQDQFRRVFHGVTSIGGRYSALSNFGMVPAALMGIDVKRFLECAEEMVHACSPTVLPRENPGVLLGVMLGVMAEFGKDKVTIVASPAIKDLGAWLEQLLAESTGKEGKGLIPVDREKLGWPSSYGDDRIFAYIRLDANPDLTQDKALDALEKAGHPVVRLHMQDIYHLGAEFFRWEIATAVAGSIIGINAFNQPDVEASKIATRQLTLDFEKKGELPVKIPVFEDKQFQLFTDEKNKAALFSSLNADAGFSEYLKALLNRMNLGDYFDISAFIEMNDAHESVLQECREIVRDARVVATCLGFGPRFLHSTGQAYKGGPNTGVFLQVTCDDKNDLAIPEQKYSFGLVKECQARGDFTVLAERNRRALRVHIKGDLKSGLNALKAGIIQALK